jgi:hypothetical protein
VVVPVPLPLLLWCVPQNVALVVDIWGPQSRRSRLLLRSLLRRLLVLVLELHVTLLRLIEFEFSLLDLWRSDRTSNWCRTGQGIELVARTHVRPIIKVWTLKPCSAVISKERAIAYVHS